MTLSTWCRNIEFPFGMLHAILHLAPWGQVVVVSPKTRFPFNSDHRSAGTRPNKLTYTAAMSACEQGTVTSVDCIQKMKLSPWGQEAIQSVNLKMFEYWIVKRIWPYPSFSRRMLGWCFAAFVRDARSWPDRLWGCSELLRTTLGRSFASVAWYAAWRRAPGWLCWLGGWCLFWWANELFGFNAVWGKVCSMGCWVQAPRCYRTEHPWTFFPNFHIHCYWQDFNQTLLFAVLPLLLAKKAESVSRGC